MGIAEIEKYVAYSLQINPLVSPIMVLSGMKMQNKLWQNCPKAQNISTKLDPCDFTVWIWLYRSSQLDVDIYQQESSCTTEEFLSSM